MKKLLGMAIGLVMLLPSPAFADHDGGYEEGCGRGGGGCNNEREEDYSGAGCKYVCPSFDKSPVHDAFNFSPFICMPGATCYEKPNDREEQPNEHSGESH